MYTLCINTALADTQIALINDKKIISEKSWESKRDEAEKLMPEIEKMINENVLTYKDLNHIFVVNGPGSFTSLRVGLSVANTIAYLLNIPVYGINTIEFLWNYIPVTNEKTAVILYAGSSGLYLSLNRDTGDYGKEILNIHIDKIQEYLNEKGIKYLFGEVSESQKELLNGYQFIENKMGFAENCLNILLKNIIPAQKIIRPVYIKTPDITLSKKII